MFGGTLIWLATKHHDCIDSISILNPFVPGFNYFRNVGDYKSAIRTSLKEKFFNNYKGMIIQM